MGGNRRLTFAFHTTKPPRYKNRHFTHRGCLDIAISLIGGAFRSMSNMASCIINYHFSYFCYWHDATNPWVRSAMPAISPPGAMARTWVSDEPGTAISLKIPSLYM